MWSVSYIFMVLIIQKVFYVYLCVYSTLESLNRCSHLMKYSICENVHSKILFHSFRYLKYFQLKKIKFEICDNLSKFLYIIQITLFKNVIKIIIDVTINIPLSSIHITWI